MLRRVLMVGMVLLLQAAARADTYLVSGSGTWGPDAPTTTVSGPGETWSFSYIETAPLTPAADGPLGSPADFSYKLSGTSVPEPLLSVEYSSQANDGLFTLSFAGGDVLALYGPQVYDANLYLIPGVYDSTIDADQTLPPPAGEGSGTVTIATVPEPASLTLLGAGLGLATLATARRSRRRVAAA